MFEPTNLHSKSTKIVFLKIWNEKITYTTNNIQFLFVFTFDDNQLIIKKLKIINALFNILVLNCTSVSFIYEYSRESRATWVQNC